MKTSKLHLMIIVVNVKCNWLIKRIDVGTYSNIIRIIPTKSNSENQYKERNKFIEMKKAKLRIAQAIEIVQSVFRVLKIFARNLCEVNNSSLHANIAEFKYFIGAQSGVCLRRDDIVWFHSSHDSIFIIKVKYIISISLREHKMYYTFETVFEWATPHSGRSP